jgi:hypothetical protein
VEGTAGTEGRIAKFKEMDESFSREISAHHTQAEAYKGMRGMLKWERGIDPGAKGAAAVYSQGESRNEGDSLNKVKLRILVRQLRDSMIRRVDSINQNAGSIELGPQNN